MKNKTKNTILVEKLEIAETFFSRFLGLMGRDKFPSGSGIWIKKSGNSIHTFFMKVAIDVLFIDQKGIVKFLKENVKPWRLVFAPTFSKTDCLELPVGTIRKTSTRAGDYVCIET